MSIVDDCVKFLEDLIFGDFNEQQMVSAQVVAGLVSLIPGIDQVMDLRDVSGCLYRINKHGGLAKATLEQKIDLGFAAFGVVPSVGSAFKTVFKPLYKQRKAARGLVNGGVAMIERMLGHKKGGAVRWVRSLNWAGETQAAILKANLALDSCIAMLDYLGQSHWWCPNRIEQLARDVAPALKSMRGKLAAPIREAATEIRQFLEELLGEHAAAVALAVATSGPMARRSPQTARPSRTSRAAAGPAHKTVGSTPRTQARGAQGRTTNVVQQTAFDIYAGLDFAAKGLMGEHIVEHYVIEKKNWGLQWNRHDMSGPARGGVPAGWQSEHRKLNDDGIPTYLCTPKHKTLANGIDSLWKTNRARPHQYAVVEAKASMNPDAQLYQLLGEARDQSSPVRTSSGAGRRRPTANKAGGARASGAPQAEKVMQMSNLWIRDRILKDFSTMRSQILGNYSRHVFLVSPLQATQHINAMSEIIAAGYIAAPGKAQKFSQMHSAHEIQMEFGEAHLKEAEKSYQANGRYKRSSPNGRRPKGT